MQLLVADVHRCHITHLQRLSYCRWSVLAALAVASCLCWQATDDCSQEDCWGQSQLEPIL